ncbi:MAG: glycoside hydrolase family 9 protein [Blautia sp.]|nr:glycoside hydrolase family 9 protein [Blautia sp.]MCM1201473.1 glycoside hydrolase family 9 protein [Bacteroides fragilis]
MRRKYLYSIIPILLCAALLGGCTELEDFMTAGGGQQTQEEEIVSLGLTPEFDYEVPVNLPNIMIDQVGYAANSNKIAVFRGEALPDTYDLVDVETETVVYTGIIKEKGYNAATGENISYGDFSDFKTPGTYYLQTEIVGRSYAFIVAQNPYADIFDAALKQYYYSRCGLTLSTEHAGEAAHNACHTKMAELKDDTAVQLDVSGGWHIDENGTRNVTDGCQAVNNLLLAYELYENIFTDEIGIPESGNGIPDLMDEVRYEVDWLLKMQDATSGAVYSAVSAIEESGTSYRLYAEPVTMDATIQFAAAMAKFSYLYQNYDRDFATQCLKAADRAYRYAEKYLSDVSPEEYFHAAAELYRATGAFHYREAVHQYLDGKKEFDWNNDYVFWGSVVYISTKQKVDVDLCETVITKLLSDVEQISYDSKKSKYLTEGNKEQDNNCELLRKMVRLAVVDHIITNHEYMMVLENHLHYFLGRNPACISYLDDVGSRNYVTVDARMGIMKQIDHDAELVVLLSAIQDNLRTVEESGAAE